MQNTIEEEIEDIRVVRILQKKKQQLKEAEIVRILEPKSLIALVRQQQINVSKVHLLITEEIQQLGRISAKFCESLLTMKLLILNKSHRKGYSCRPLLLMLYLGRVLE